MIFDHVIKALNEFIVRSLSRYVTILRSIVDLVITILICFNLAKLSGYKHFGSRNIMVSFCHVTWQNLASDQSVIFIVSNEIRLILVTRFLGNE